jgi:hypothetical protein
MMEITSRDDVTAVAFKVCTALHHADTTAVLTGGSAATVYAPSSYSSLDADFIAYHLADVLRFRQVIHDLGFEDRGGTYVHSLVPITLDFPSEDIRIGSQPRDRYETLEQDGLILHILTPTDCVCDRLASFFWFNDRSALLAACAVASRQAKADLDEVREWTEDEGEAAKFEQFIDRLRRYRSEGD